MYCIKPNQVRNLRTIRGLSILDQIALQLLSSLDSVPFTLADCHVAGGRLRGRLLSAIASTYIMECVAGSKPGLAVARDPHKILPVQCKLNIQVHTQLGSMLTDTVLSDALSSGLQT